MEESLNQNFLHGHCCSNLVPMKQQRVSKRAAEHLAVVIDKAMFEDCEGKTRKVKKVLIAGADQFGRPRRKQGNIMAGGWL